jgi:Zn-dependent protease with chaperone function
MFKKNLLVDEKSYPELYAAIQEVNQKMGVQLRVYITPDPDKGVEAAINPLTKSVFITEALSRLPTPQIKAVLAHEAHHAQQPRIKHVVSTLATAISIPVAVATSVRRKERQVSEL